MSSLEPADLDVATLAWLAGSTANDWLLDAIHRSGHPALRISHGYLIQRLLVGNPTIGELAGALGVTQQAASKSISELESLGYVRRAADAGDQRIRRVELTEHGRDAVEQARRARRDLEAALAAHSGEDLEAARSILAHLLELTGGLESVRARRVTPPAI